MASLTTLRPASAAAGAPFSPAMAEAAPASVDAELERFVAAWRPGRPQLAEALAHVLLAPAKRVRPRLALLMCAAHGGAAGAARPLALALELVHTASLVIDDLPAMDDARTRRGRPTLHRVFGMDTAILAGFALLNGAYGLIATADLPPAHKIWLTAALAEAVGPAGLVGGQDADMRGLGPGASFQGLCALNHAKTGVLFQLALEGGARLAGAPETACAAARAAGAALGHAFQLADDLLDGLPEAHLIGKDTGQDRGKLTAVALLGAEAARHEAESALAEARRHLAAGGGAVAALDGYIVTMFHSLLARLDTNPR